MFLHFLSAWRLSLLAIKSSSLIDSNHGEELWVTTFRIEGGACLSSTVRKKSQNWFAFSTDVMIIISYKAQHGEKCHLPTPALYYFLLSLYLKLHTLLLSIYITYVVLVTEFAQLWVIAKKISVQKILQTATTFLTWQYLYYLQNYVCMKVNGCWLFSYYHIDIFMNEICILKYRICGNWFSIPISFFYKVISLWLLERDVSEYLLVDSM